MRTQDTPANLLPTREQGSIVPGYELFANAPGYNPFDLQGDAPIRNVPPTQLWLGFQQENWRGGRIDVIEFRSPAPDVAMHFIQTMLPRPQGQRFAFPDLLVTCSFMATVTYNGAPNEYPGSGVYYNITAKKGRHTYGLKAGELAVGRPQVFPYTEQQARQISDQTDERSTEAHRVVANPDELTETIGLFGWALGLDIDDRQQLATYITSHLAGARTYRQWKKLEEGIQSGRA